jgi:hypothetical protein
MAIHGGRTVQLDAEAHRTGPRRRGRNATTAGLVLAVGLTGVLTGPAPAGAARAARTDLSPCVDPDNGLPEVRDVALSRTSVDVTDATRQVTVSMQVADTGGPGSASGVEYVGGTLVSPGRDLGLGVPMRHDSGTTWTGTVTVPRGAPPGSYRFDYLRVFDEAGNEPSEEHVAAMLAQPAFDVALDVTSSDPDDEPPTVTDISISPNRLNTRRKPRRVRVAIDVRDDVSGVADVRTSLRGHGHNVPIELAERDGRWVGTARIPRWLGRDARRWRLQAVSAVDRVGNRASHYRLEDLKRLGEATFRVRSGPKDRSRPRLRSARVRPRKVDVRVDPRRVRFVVRLRDGRSGVGHVEAGVPARWTTLRRTAGTARRGTWKGSIRLTPCTKHLHGSIVRVVAFDRAGNEMDEITGRLRIRGRDNERPSASLTEQEWSPTGPVVIRFDETVHGVSTDSVTVRPYPYPTMGDPLAGSWSCADVDDAATDCRTGEVRTATWSPAEPLPADSQFLVELNPSGVLDVMDAAGNPFRRKLLGGFTR